MLASLVLTALVERTQLHMGTFATIKVPENRPYMIEEGFRRIKRVEKALSTYNYTSQTYRLNEQKHIETSSFDLLEALNLSKKYFTQTHGYFSIAVGTITKDLYHFGEDIQTIPSINSLQQANSESLGYSIKANQITLDDNVTIDFGGMGKGFAVDKVKQLFNGKNVPRYVIGLSGDIYCKGQCEVSIASPFTKDTTLYTFTLTNSAISTSGNYERFVKTKQHNHLINPKTKQSEQEIISMTLLSQTESNANLDAYATALSVMPKHTLETFLHKHKSINYLFITRDKQQCISKEIRNLLKVTQTFNPCRYNID